MQVTLEDLRAGRDLDVGVGPAIAGRPGGRAALDPPFGRIERDDYLILTRRGEVPVISADGQGWSTQGFKDLQGALPVTTPG